MFFTLIWRAKSTDYAHAPSYLMGSLCSDDEVESYSSHKCDLNISTLGKNPLDSPPFPVVKKQVKSKMTRRILFKWQKQMNTQIRQTAFENRIYVSKQVKTTL